MRTWKQGVIGILSLPDSTKLYVKCLKYPLAEFFQDDETGQLAAEKAIFTAFVELSTLKFIDRIDSQKLSKEEREKGEGFDFDSRTDRVTLSMKASDAEPLDEVLCGMAELQARYRRYKKTGCRKLG